MMRRVSLFLSCLVPVIVGYCMVNEDCGDVDRLCCSITPALGKRQLDSNFMVHYCLPYKNENATWCSLNVQHSPEIQNYYSLCPCGPGLRCTPTTELDPHSYPRHRYGKCTHVV
ncbi:uncharacterized protein LOC111127345 [Crassostrea virginica]|uniref:Uncharacterized protein LOC111122764 n=1 Tax=Crassostrea virginica TaxID=6565 RepID=A0A8B8CX48_CRAVI|nr:uncharacterized protein LOC111122764 [Crassostrea virginica]